MCSNVTYAGFCAWSQWNIYSNLCKKSISCVHTFRGSPDQVNKQGWHIYRQTQTTTNLRCLTHPSCHYSWCTKHCKDGCRGAERTNTIFIFSLMQAQPTETKFTGHSEIILADLLIVLLAFCTKQTHWEWAEHSCVSDCSCFMCLLTNTEVWQRSQQPEL